MMMLYKVDLTGWKFVYFHSQENIEIPILRNSDLERSVRFWINRVGFLPHNRNKAFLSDFWKIGDLFGIFSRNKTFKKLQDFPDYNLFGVIILM